MDIEDNKQTPKKIFFKIFDPDETRTRNLLIRSQTPYPLGHEAASCYYQNYIIIMVVIIMHFKKPKKGFVMLQDCFMTKNTKK